MDLEEEEEEEGEKSLPFQPKASFLERDLGN
jgi:hypothetical protein